MNGDARPIDEPWRARATARRGVIGHHWSAYAESPQGRWTASGWALTRAQAEVRLTAALIRLADLAIASTGDAP